jgi:hypothetical protein
VFCPICEKRKAERFCPAKAERICAVCCGTEREVSIDCPSDCGYLAAAHRYEDRHPRSLPADTPLLSVRLTADIVHTHQQLLSAIAFTVARFCSAEATAADPDVLAAIEALAESYRTLSSGIVYEKPPVIPVQKQLYNALSTFLTEMKQQGQSPVGTFKDSEVFHLLVFLFRMGLMRSTGRPRSRRFIEFLRGQFPGAQELKKEESRIIVP